MHLKLVHDWLSCFFLGLQYIREKLQNPLGSQVGLLKLAVPERSAEEMCGADPDVQLCYCIESTFMEIITTSTQGL